MADSAVSFPFEIGAYRSYLALVYGQPWPGQRHPVKPASRQREQREVWRGEAGPAHSVQAAVNSSDRAYRVRRRAACEGTLGDSRQNASQPFRRSLRCPFNRSHLLVIETLGPRR
jgi:hypothetical protein